MLTLFELFGAAFRLFVVGTAFQYLYFQHCTPGKIQCENSCRRMLTLFELFGTVFLFIWRANGVPTPPF